jgi:hypothetical protein
MGIFGFFRKRQAEKKEAVAPAEQRLLPRWEINCLAKVHWEGRSDFVFCQLKDLSFRGFKIALLEQLPEDCTSIELRFSDDFIVAADIKLLWHRRIENQETYGAYFIRLRDQDKERLYQFVSHNFPDQIERHIRGS